MICKIETFSKLLKLNKYFLLAGNCYAYRIIDSYVLCFLPLRLKIDDFIDSIQPSIEILEGVEINKYLYAYCTDRDSNWWFGISDICYYYDSIYKVKVERKIGLVEVDYNE